MRFAQQFSQDSYFVKIGSLFSVILHVDRRIDGHTSFLTRVQFLDLTKQLFVNSLDVVYKSA
jgi:hypothetical protein